jgi:hypothetical protein
LFYAYGHLPGTFTPGVLIDFFIGAWVGTVVTFGTSGFLCQSGFDNGWGSIFYLTGNFNIWFI